MTAQFLEAIPTVDSSWGAIVLFGRNCASYKFALAQALLDVAEGGASFVALDDLAVPYARALAIVDLWRTEDVRPGRGGEVWLDALVRKG